MAGTVVFQVGSIATPGPGIVIGQDNVGGTAWQYVKLDVGATGASLPVAYNSGTGLPVNILGSVFGTVQTFGTSQALGTVRTLIGGTGLGEQFFGTLFTAGQTNGTLVPAPAQGTFVRVFDILVSGSAAGTAFLEFGDGTAFGPVIMAANGGYVFNSARGVRTRGTALDILFNATSGSWGVTVNYILET